MSNIIPTLGSIGVYTFSAPFNTTLPANENYTCEGIRSIKEMVADGIDVLNTIYVLNGLSETEYNLALESNVYIISLHCATGLWVNVPSNYISNPPESNGIPYSVAAFGISLGPMPVDTDLSAIQTSISNLIRDNLGIVPTIKKLELSKVKIFSHENDAIIKNARSLLINNSTTDTANLLIAQQNLDRALLKITQLEQFIKDHKADLNL